MTTPALMKSRLVRTILKVLLIVLIAGGVIYRLRFAALPVETVPVVQGEIVSEVLGAGTLEARFKTVVSAKISGRLEEVLVDQNERVARGQLLARLDDRSLRTQVELAEASTEVARASVDRIRADEARSQATAKQARQEFERISTLVERKTVSQSDLDKAVENLHVAEAGIRQATAATVEAGLQVVTAERNLSVQKEALDDTRILSPFAGLVVRRDRDPGDIVVPGASILHLIATEEMWVSAWVDETAMADLAPDQPARIIFRSEPEAEYPGRVVRLGRETDRETREFLVDVRVEKLPANWAVGQRADVQIETGRKAGVPVVSESLLIWRSGGPGVFVDEDGRARWRAVILGRRGRGEVEIVQGLEVGARVVVPPATGRPDPEGRRIKAP